MVAAAASAFVTATAWSIYRGTNRKTTPIALALGWSTKVNSIRTYFIFNARFAELSGINLKLKDQQRINMYCVWVATEFTNNSLQSISTKNFRLTKANGAIRLCVDSKWKCEPQWIRNYIEPEIRLSSPTPVYHTCAMRFRASAQLCASLLVLRCLGARVIIVIADVRMKILTHVLALLFDAFMYFLWIWASTLRINCRHVCWMEFTQSTLNISLLHFRCITLTKTQQWLVFAGACLFSDAQAHLCARGDTNL